LKAVQREVAMIAKRRKTKSPLDPSVGAFSLRFEAI
jgi:hypothetical protein